MEYSLWNDIHRRHVVNYDPVIKVIFIYKLC